MRISLSRPGWILSAIAMLLLAQPSAAQQKPRAQRQRPLYDSTQVSFVLPAGISHKAAQQAVRTYGKVGAGQALDHQDSLFLRQWSPDYLQAAKDRPTPARPKR